MIPYGRQWISEEDIEAVDTVLQSDFLTQGPVLPVFEQALAQYCGSAHAVGVNSGSSALHLACMALGLGPEHTIWTTPNTFVATASCARHCGAQVDFVDIDPDTLNLCPEHLAEKLGQAAQQNRLPYVVIPVHFAGLPCDMKAIADLAEQYGFAVIEDSAHALGAEYDGTKIGDCRHASMAAFSFHPVKLITTGEGGAVTTKDPDLARHLFRLRSNGITRDPGMMEHESEGDWYYEQIELGHNYRMTDIQAALGHSQLRSIDSFLDNRRRLAARYDHLLEELPVRRAPVTNGSNSAWHLYVIQVPPALRSSVFTGMRAAGIGVNVHYIPLHLQPYYRRLGYRQGDFPNAEHYYAGALTLPLFPQLTEEQQDQVVDVLRRVLNEK